MTRTPAASSPVHVYGPVPSRRLGFSLGVDILRPKTCTLDCVYCQLGPTRGKTGTRKTFFSVETVLAQIRKAIEINRSIDFITFSGSGEPTLNSRIGALIRGIKRMTSIPVAVITNSTLLHRRPVREAIRPADVVIPSLDAVTDDVFQRLNRPHPTLSVGHVLGGLKAFRKEFKGRLWLEVMLVRGINDSPPHLQRLKKVIEELGPDKIQLNTVVRPPAVRSAKPVTRAKLEEVRRFLGPRCEIIAPFSRQLRAPSLDDLEKAILNTAGRRPVSARDIARSLGRQENEVRKVLLTLLGKKRIRKEVHKGTVYYGIK